MKKIVFYLATNLLAAIAAGLFFVACTPAAKEFDKSLLYSGTGEWVSTQDVGDGPEEIHDKFLANGTGSSRSETGDSPLQAFKWTLYGETLTFIHEVGGTYGLPKEYTVVTLTETTLIYNDSWGKNISCTKLMTGGGGR